MFVLIDAYLSPCAQEDVRRLCREKLQQCEKPIDVWCALERLSARIDFCTMHPEHGQYRRDLWGGMLSDVVDDMVFYYRRAGDDIEVLSIGTLADDPHVQKFLRENELRC